MWYEIVESFLGFEDVYNHSVAALETKTIDIIEENGLLSINKCRGQGYDGASVMSGIYKGVQARIFEK